jgi:hypothetical protein
VKKDSLGRMIWGKCRHCSEEVHAQRQGGTLDRPDRFVCAECGGMLWEVCQECGTPTTISSTGAAYPHSGHKLDRGILMPVYDKE